MMPELDKKVAELVILRDSFWTTGTYERCRCITCGKDMFTDATGAFAPQAGHFIPRRFAVTRYLPINIHAQCYTCNVLRSGNVAIHGITIACMYHNAIQRLMSKRFEKDSFILHDNTVFIQPSVDFDVVRNAVKAIVLKEPDLLSCTTPEIILAALHEIIFDSIICKRLQLAIILKNSNRTLGLVEATKASFCVVPEIDLESLIRRYFPEGYQDKGHAEIATPGPSCGVPPEPCSPTQGSPEQPPASQDCKTDRPSDLSDEHQPQAESSTSSA